MWSWVKWLFVVVWGVVFALVMPWQATVLFGGFLLIIWLVYVRPRRGWKKDFDGLPDHVRQRYLEYERARSRHVSAESWTRVGAAFGQASRDSDRAAQATRRGN